jgi:phosphoribosylformylglycinamidine synthase
MVSAKEEPLSFIALKGQQGFSEFRLKALLELIREDFSQIQAINCEDFFFSSLHSQSNELIKLTENELSKILKAKVFKRELKANQFILIPRVGTISPWSSKATDILINAGLDSLKRIEKGLCFSLETPLELGKDSIKEIGQKIYDRMTQSVITDISSAEHLFRQLQPKPVLAVDILKDGKKSLYEANDLLGLALSEEEIEYLYMNYLENNSNPTDAELMMFAQANSEHCRHKIFNAEWEIDGKKAPKSLFDMIRNTYAKNSNGVLSAYKDNAAVLKGHKAKRFYPNSSSVYITKEEPIHLVTKVETHNHPTAISPFPGASTGSGGEIRDEGATGRGAKPKAGLCGFSVSNLRIPDFEEDWEGKENKPDRICSPLQIMLEAPIGAAAFNNEFGRPNILGYFRTFEMTINDNVYGYHKPIMLAGGLGNIRNSHVEKSIVPVGSKLVVLGGPAMLIGLGGGSASSLLSGEAELDLDFASVQRDNAEMERRCQEVLDSCWQRGDSNPILFIHDVGAGGLSNAIPELIKDSGHGGFIELRDIPNAELAMSPMEIWCNESQERYVMAIGTADLQEFLDMCDRERCPVAVVGEITEGSSLKVHDSLFNNYPIDISLDTIFGNTPQTIRKFNKESKGFTEPELIEPEISSLIKKVLRHPTVGGKGFLITIGDRSITGLISRDQMVGPWQVPVADNSVTLSSFFSSTGEAMSIGERTPCAVINSSAASRMAVAEAVTNIISSGIEKLSDIKLSANWMGAPEKLSGNQDLFQAVEAVGMDLCPKWGICIPVGKDSLSMATSWKDKEKKDHSVISPLSLIVSAFAPLKDVSLALTPQIDLTSDNSSELIFIDLAKGKKRMGGSIAFQVSSQFLGSVPDVECVNEMPKLVEALHQLINEKKIIAYHDRSDGGLICSLLEMAFAGRSGLDIKLDQICTSYDQTFEALFNEELGIVIQVPSKHIEEVIHLVSEVGFAKEVFRIASPNKSKLIKLFRGKELAFEWKLGDLLEEWNFVSYKMQSLRDNPETANQEYQFDTDEDRKGLSPKLSYNIPKKLSYLSTRPSVAILREQGVNGQVEMAAAFDRVGFSCTDVHMTDLITGRKKLEEFSGLVACGGFSYGDVLGAGVGWATSILYNESLRKDFQEFFSRDDVFTLGVCNGCQAIALLSDLIPGSNLWPKFVRNKSEKFEARLIQLLIGKSPSIFFKGMDDSVLPVAVAHGEGQVSLGKKEINTLLQKGLVPITYANDEGLTTESYPQNPNGSLSGIAGVTNASGTITLMMPHPERSFLSAQHSWKPENWDEYSPWIKFFLNAREFIG